MKRASFWIILILLVSLVTDTIFYLAMYKINETRNLFYERTDITRERIEFWLKNSYSPALGWDLPATERNNLGVRRSKDYLGKDVYKIKAFGDSFTYGAEVKVDSTWEAIVEMKTGWDCLNYGVGAFGTDQAFLKYRLNGVKTEYTVLGIYCENIGRIGSLYPAFYMREWAPPKPRFIMQGDTIKLIENPIASPDRAFNLLDKAYVNALKKLDYWPRYYEEVLDAPARLTWPAFYTIFNHWPFFYDRAKIEFQRICCPSYEIETQTYKYYHLYERTNELFQLLKYIIEQFVSLSQERQEHPVVLIFPDQFSLDLIKKYAKIPHQLLIDFLNERRYDYLDFSVLFIQQNYASYYNFYNSHFSPGGNNRVADELISLIKKLDQGKL